MSFIDRVLHPPAYGWKDEGNHFIRPTQNQIFSEFLFRLNFFRNRKNWLGAIGWIWVLCLLPCMVLSLSVFFHWWTIPAMLLYGAIVMSTHGTVWYHRYGSHRAFEFKNRFWRFLTQNLVIKVIPEEVYIISHHVHHSRSDKTGDPYNAAGGFLYCFLADTNHQQIARDLNETDYGRVVKLLRHTGIALNSFAQYLKWGSATPIFFLLSQWILNWSIWFGIFFLIGGPSLACAMFSGALLWVLMVRTFNYNGHGQGKDLKQDGIDFYKHDLSINQSRPGLLGGEWHNNHHLYPRSARSGFLPNQWDNAWAYIWLLHKIGGISSYLDYKEHFFRDHIHIKEDKIFEKDCIADKSQRTTVG